MEESTSMLKPTVRNLYQFMSVQAELHDPKAAYYYSINRGNAFLLVKTLGSVFEVNRLPNSSYVIKITKDRIVQAYANIPQFGKTKVYKSGIRVTD